MPSDSAAPELLQQTLDKLLAKQNDLLAKQNDLQATLAISQAGDIVHNRLELQQIVLLSLAAGIAKSTTGAEEAAESIAKLCAIVLRTKERAYGSHHSYVREAEDLVAAVKKNWPKLDEALVLRLRITEEQEKALIPKPELVYVDHTRSRGRSRSPSRNRSRSRSRSRARG